MAQFFFITIPNPVKADEFLNLKVVGQIEDDFCSSYFDILSISEINGNGNNKALKVEEVGTAGIADIEARGMQLFGVSEQID